MSDLALPPAADGQDAPQDAVLLRTEHVTKIYPDGQVQAVLDVSLSIRAGEYVAIMGPSGSGKSTLLNLLGALDRPTSGALYFQGRDYARVRDLDRLRAGQFGFVFQSFYLLPILTAVENVQVPMFESALPARQRQRKAVELLKLVGVEHRANHLPEQLSVGERQRVAVARALANDPIVLLADEPTGNLDSVNAQAVFDLFERLHRERGVTLVLITHDPDLAARANRLVHMRDGRLRTDGPTAKGER
jgi:putative ABC transport system ATP-binding protein